MRVEPFGRKVLGVEPPGWAPNNPLQRRGTDGVPGRGRWRAVPKQIWCARVLKRQCPAAERGR